MSARVIPLAACIAVAVLAYNLFSLTSDRHGVLSTWSSPEELSSFEPDMQIYPNYMKTDRGLVLLVNRHLVPNPKGIVFLFHGFCEHQNRYTGLSYELNKLGLNVVSIDHAGHGGSQGDRSYTPAFRHYILDAIQFINFEYRNMRESLGPYAIPAFKFDNLSAYDDKFFIFGHSMGGLISTLVGIEYGKRPEQFPFKSTPKFILSAPALALDKKLTDAPVMIALSNYLSTYLPRLQVQTMPQNKLSHIDSVSQLVDRDPLMNGPAVVARFGAEFIGAIQLASQDASHFKSPVLIMHSADDNIIDIVGSRAFVTLISTPEEHRTLVECKGYHEVLADIDRPQLIQKIGEFVSRYL